MGFAARGGWWVVAQTVLFVATLVAAWTLGPEAVATWQRRVGDGAFVLGAVLGIAGALPLGRALSPFPAPAGSARLRTRGIHGLARHPIYGGVILLFAGIAIRSGSLVALALAAVLVPFFWAKSTFEERLLQARFPEYADYRERVPRRFIPFVI